MSKNLQTSRMMSMLSFLPSRVAGGLDSMPNTCLFFIFAGNGLINPFFLKRISAVEVKFFVNIRLISFWKPILPHPDSSNFLRFLIFTGGPDSVSSGFGVGRQPSCNPISNTVIANQNSQSSGYIDYYVISTCPKPGQSIITEKMSQGLFSSCYNCSSL